MSVAVIGEVVAAGKQPFQFSFGDTINVTADRGIRHPGSSNFEAIGNAVISYFDETIYGEKATLYMDRGYMDIKGNVRYTGPTMTLYGQELSYDVKSGKITVHNARIVSEGYTVVGEYMARISPEVIIGENAEYTTCTDCPESWSIFGKKIRLTINDYIHIQNALIKMNGVVIMYVPYVILPIKRGRQTGLLFPQLTLHLKYGLQYRQPWFWAINESSDMTLTPGSIGERGYADETEYRKIFGESKWVELHSMQAMDRLYLPPKKEKPGRERDKETGTYYFRHFSDYEHHLQFGNYVNHHLYSTYLREGDMIGDYPRYSLSRLMGSELPVVGTFFDFRNSFANLSVESYYNRNLITPDPMLFDDYYVQVLPKVSLQIPPVILFYNRYWPIFKNASVGADMDYTDFRQKRIYTGMVDGNGIWQPKQNIRNASRVNMNPYLAWTWGRVGPISLESKAKFENSFYRFPYENKEKWFVKNGTVFVSEAYFEIDKTFGLAYQENIPTEKVTWVEDAPASDALCSQCPQCKSCLEEAREKREEELKIFRENKVPYYGGTAKNEEGGGGTMELVGDIPLTYAQMDNYLIEPHNGYRHSIFFNVRHFFTSNQSYRGSREFERQIESGSGLFDYLDAPRRLKHVIGSNVTRTGIDERNSLEIRVLNSLFQKSPKAYDYAKERDEMHNRDYTYLPGNFSYGKVASLNISQGITLNTGEKKFTDNLTSLNIDGGMTLWKWGIGFSDYYFYKTHIHKFSTGISRAFDYFSFNFSMTYDGASTPPAKNWAFSSTILPWPTMRLDFTYEYDIVLEKYKRAVYAYTYTPENRCWKLTLNYSSYPDTSGEEIIFNIFVNFGENRYNSLFSQVGSDGGV
ncbi:MAG: LPS-assembly protein LptD [Oligoflexia bacterium]|nr:LPS-assembly protein LptD [Oligoflexia bacterium]MBF0366818.1 LPS-assembly protein LptD [Oligoflexia bacterium]